MRPLLQVEASALAMGTGGCYPAPLPVTQGRKGHGSVARGGELLLPARPDPPVPPLGHVWSRPLLAVCSRAKDAPLAAARCLAELFLHLLRWHRCFFQLSVVALQRRGAAFLWPWAYRKELVFPRTYPLVRDLPRAGHVISGGSEAWSPRCWHA